MRLVFNITRESEYSDINGDGFRGLDSNGGFNEFTLVFVFA